MDVAYGDEVVKDYTFMDEGQAAHKLSEWCFTEDLLATDYPRDSISWVDDVRGILFHKIDDAMRKAVDEYVATVKAMAEGSPIFVEQRVYIFGEDVGTSDVVVLKPGELQVHDLKYGRKPVTAENNPQLKLYGRGAWRLIDSLFDTAPDKVRLVIHQPKLRYVDEWVTDAKTLKDFEDYARIVRDGIVTSVFMEEKLECNPGTAQCSYCDHKARCVKLEQFVRMLIMDDIVDVGQPVDADQIKAGTDLIVSGSDNSRIADLLPHIELIEGWCKAVITKARAELMAGNKIEGFKLVEGKAGNRAWRDLELAVRTLKSMKLKKGEMFTEKLKSPTQIEALVGDEKYMKKLANIVHRPEGTPIMVPESNKKPALIMGKPDDGFDNLDEELVGATNETAVGSGMEDLV